ncbi:MAG: transposase [bacterium]|nr:transposase [bacterium]
MEGHPQRKRIRLEAQSYAMGACSVTIGIHERSAAFQDHALAGIAVRAIGDAAVDAGVVVHAYCVMPDHVHVLLEVREGVNPSPTNPDEAFPAHHGGGVSSRPLVEAQPPMIAFIRLLKGRTIAGARRQHLVHHSFWQRSFYDYFLRHGETIEVVTRYILNNPVRGQLVARWDQWPWSGSLVLSHEDLVAVMDGRG